MNTVNSEEIHKFSHNDWWNYDSLESKMLHKLNILRMEFVLSLVQVNGENILDVGCGGGIASESLAMCGGNVTAIDASKQAIDCAMQHAKKGGLKIDYQNVPIEDFSQKKFDIVFANDIIEHVENPSLFLQEIGKRVKENGLLVISTINKNIFSTVFAKFAAEYVLNLVPRGTHDEKKFIKSSFIRNNLEDFTHIKTQGFSYNPITKQFFFEPTALMNYFIVLQKNGN